MAVTCLGEPFFNQEYDAPIGLRPNDATGRLQDPVETGILVGIGKATVILAIEIILEQIVLQAYLGHSHADDDGAD